jgi:hypothetical protein
MLVGLAAATPAAAQGSAFTLTLGVPSTVAAGSTVTLHADVMAPGPTPDNLVVTFDPKAIGLNKFVTRLQDAGGYTCYGGRYCFFASLPVDVYTRPGRYPLTVIATDAGGRRVTSTVQIEVQPPVDRDGDGLPDEWEDNYSLVNEGASGDPDQDGVSNIDEFRANTHPRGRYLRAFTEGSYGEQQSLVTCFVLKSVPADRSGIDSAIRVRAIGDDGRTSDQFFKTGGNTRVCPLGERAGGVAARIVSVQIESADEIAVERVSYERGEDSWRPLNASLGVQSPAREWFFARGGAERGLDLFFLAFNPSSEPVDATFTFVGGSSGNDITMTRTLAPGVRTTIWVNQDAPDAAAFDAATTVTAPSPIYIERAWRHRAPGRSAAHDSVGRGASVPSTWWYFAAGDLSAAFDTSFAAFNPTGQDTKVDATFLFADREPQQRTIDLAARTRQIIRPRDLGIGGAAVALTLHARDGVGIVAERTTDGAAGEQAWRLSALGVTSTATQWTFADFERGEVEILIANPSDTDARVRLLFLSRNLGGTQIEFIDVPARRVVSFPALTQADGFVVVQSDSRNGRDPAPIVVERVSYVDVEGVRRARQVSIVGNSTR